MGINKYYVKKISQGFTIVELLVVIVVLATLATLVISALGPQQSKETAREVAATNELPTIGNAVKLYIYKNNTYPPETGDILLPADIIQNMEGGTNNTLPNGPWTGSYYYYDAWSVAPASMGAIDTYQISIRFCSQTTGAICNSANSPPASWSTGFDGTHSAYYYCIKGYCRPGGPGTTTTGVPGYCINCGTSDHSGVKYAGE